MISHVYSKISQILPNKYDFHIYLQKYNFAIKSLILKYTIDRY